MNAAVRMLYLEDDPADARLIREHLRKSGLDADIVIAGSREVFETELSTGGYDLVLSDFHVPGFSGLEALELVRALDPHLPFILVTGALGDERAVELLRSGATDCVLKDRLARLAPAIKRAVSEHVAQRRHNEIQARLAEAHRLSKLAAEAARMGSWQLNLAGGTLDCSEEFLSLLGVQRTDWAGTIGALEALMHPGDVEHRRRVHADAVKHRRFMELEFRIPRADGEVRWMYLRGDCVLGADGVPASFLGVMMDITERKQMEDALRDADRRKDEFLAMLAHELRNPLAPIYNGLSILRRTAAKSTETEKIHAMLERQMHHIIRLVDDLFDISRFTLGKIKLNLQSVELQKILQNAVEMSQPSIEARHHHLDISMPSRPVMLDADVVRLAQVLSNLLNNAARYTGEGGRLWLGARVEGDSALISVRDSGIGIPESMLDRVFDLFTQIGGDDRSTKSGLGVGLAMARMLVELHGGKVEARSAGAGQGSEFVVRLPVSASRYGVESAGSVVNSNISLNGRRVLVVDDNRDAADSLVLLLRMAGAEAHAAYDGQSALAALPTHRPQIVLLDISMPGMDGYAVANCMRQDPNYRNLILVALTGLGQENDRLRASTAGFNHHLTKPADLDSVQALIASVEPAEQSGRLSHIHRIRQVGTDSDAS